MKKILPVISMICLFIFVSCQSGKAKLDVNGTYSFDADAWKAAMGQLDPNFKNAPEELVTKTVAALGQFNMVVKDGTITANFGPNVIEGKLAEVSKTDSSAVYKMTPKEGAAPTESILVTINGNKMVAGPEGKDRELIYFKKQ